ncbi:MAG: cyclic pyranopterin monophosphate synthase MoaC [Acidobacteriota bacterium]
MSESDETREPGDLTHLDERGQARMVDVSEKTPTRRTAVAQGRVHLPAPAFAALAEDRLAKGDALAIARLAGIQGAKETSRLIPLCHPLPLDKVGVDLELDAENSRVVITATATTTARTGVEMEALTAVSVAALALHDTCKSAAKGIVIEDIVLLRKEGGKSGTWTREDG